jgi:hypothetical protein
MAAGLTRNAAVNMPFISKIGTAWHAFAAGRLALPFLVLAASGSVAATKAGTSCSLEPASGMQNPPAPLERLLSNIKAELSGGHILKVEQRSRDLEGSRLIYAVKVLPIDGRVAWLTFDACTLEPLTKPRDQPPRTAPR